MITHISFDLDGTLADDSYDHTVWDEEMPKLYAKENGIAVEEAERFVFAEYYKAEYIEKISNWTDIRYWFQRLKLDDWEGFLEKHHDKIKWYPDALSTLEELRKDFTLILATNASSELFKRKREELKLSKQFSHIFSLEDFGEHRKKNDAFFNEICEKMDVKPDNVMHIGDSQGQDYDSAIEAGMYALLIDRSGKKQGEHVIHSLSEIKSRLERFS
ncbi:MAG: HAD family hydrolase [Candidatus Woesearchaeota archaeon]